MKRYVYYQPNDKDLKDKAGDCAIRALTKATGMTWGDVFKWLCEYAIKAQRMPNDEKNVITPALIDAGWEYTKCYSKRHTVSDIAKTFTLCDTPVIMYVRSGYRTHLVTSQKGQYFDTWDCGNKLVYGYWTKGGIA